MFVDQEKDKIYKLIESDPVTTMLAEQDAIIQRLKNPAIKLDESHEKLSRIYARNLPEVLETQGTALQKVSAVLKAATDSNILDFSDPLLSLQIAIERVMDRHNIPPITLSGEQMAKVISSIDLARPYMTPAQAEAVEEIAPTIKKRLSLSDAIALLGILVTILTTLLSFAPDPQLDEIIEQQEVLIDQNDALTDAISELTKSVILLQEEIEILTEESDGLCEEDDGSSEPDKQNAQSEQDQSSGEIADAEGQ